jgi:hypothetical protein
MSSSILDELAGIDLKDRRRERRSRMVLESLANDPQASINGACDTWSETHGAYRFFDNPVVTPEALLKPHREATLNRVRQCPVVLIVQDTTELDYSGHAPLDARCLDQEYRHGMYAHAQVAVTPDQLNLGVVDLQYFDRAAETLGQSIQQRKTRPLADKESQRWLDGYRLANAVAVACPPTQIISVADREADIYDIFVEAQKPTSGPRADFIIRAKQPRSTLARDPSAGASAYRKVRDEAAAAPVLVRRTLELAATPKRSARTATLTIRAVTVTVKPPHARSQLPPVTLNVVLAQEVNGPGDGTDVSWLLLTSLPIDAAAVLRVVDDYVARWSIEVFFKTWKSGCAIEKLQLETLARLKNCLALYAIIAWRINFMTYQARATPTALCTTVFSEAEWTVVWKVVVQQPLPPQPPTLAELLRSLAQLGGYNQRKHDPPPGPQSIWIGLRRLADFLLAWKIFTRAP